ncbi:MAG: sterol desaturase family protein [Syntrophobacteraceae bacterium]|jgi:sterol desaturase/sphingolipid hydroxylase (fatty acid hydroxylase superfamily)|nr:sterol desaturase family protein [Syntrophobacteraceae bacterium]
MDEAVALRLACFLGFFALMAVLERMAPRRHPTTSRPGRWFANLAIVALNPLSVHLLFPVLPVGMALLAEERHWGLLSHLALPHGVAVLIGFAVLDLSIYLQHVLHHAVPALWRLHMVHHADLDTDLTTGLRFHPLEIVISRGVKLMTVAALGPPALAVLIFEIALNAASMFNHGNLRLPIPLDRVLRLVLVTPDMHRVHHSVIIRETNSNYGFNLPWWDRLFGTYKDQPDKGHEGMTIGLSHFRDPRRLTLPRLLILPFVGDPGGVPINRH